MSRLIKRANLCVWLWCERDNTKLGQLILYTGIQDEYRAQQTFSLSEQRGEQ